MWENVSNKAILAGSNYFTWFNFQAKIPNCPGVCFQGE